MLMTTKVSGLSRLFKVSPEIYPACFTARERICLKSGIISFARFSFTVRLIIIFTVIITPICSRKAGASDTPADALPSFRGTPKQLQYVRCNGVDHQRTGYPLYSTIMGDLSKFIGAIDLFTNVALLIFCFTRLLNDGFYYLLLYLT